MTDTPKPPMVVWLAYCWHEQFKDDTDTQASDELNGFHSVGPYVHLDQFMAEVEAEAQACADEGLSYDASFVDIIRDKVKEANNEN